MSNTAPPILFPKETYTFDYPQALEFEKQQLDVFWLADEINVEKDIQDLRVNLTEAEYHGVITVLKLFTLYELSVGDEYWLGKVRRWFKRADIRRMATAFGMTEINIHAPFYNKINEALFLNTDEFYSSYVQDPILKERMDFISKIVSSEDKLESLSAFSMIEGGVLYSSFTFLKHFQNAGKNYILNTVRGINFSVRDENLHSLAGAWLFRTLKKEMNLSDEEEVVLKNQVIVTAQHIENHESRIIDMIFEKGDIDGINSEDMKTFVRSRINLCLQNLGYEPIYMFDKNPISDWFYENINSMQIHDFFTGIGASYNRNWDETKFIFTTEV